MTDIVVRVPLKEIAHFWGDKATAPAAFWSLGVKPKQLEPGDKIFFVIDQKVMAYATVGTIRDASMGKSPIVSESDGRVWEGFMVEWRREDFVKVKNPIPGSAPTRGFAYVLAGCYDGVLNQ